jgi:hypothetical protein
MKALKIYSLVVVVTVGAGKVERLLETPPMARITALPVLEKWTRGK